jgi:RNA polymerase sigma-70 factor (ECF subfamily)
LGELYDRHQRLVYRTALAITNDGEAAADLSQDVFLRLFRFAENIDPARALEPWLYRMTTNLAYDWVKRRRRWPGPIEDLVDFISTGVRQNPSYVAEMNDEWREMYDALASLPLQQRVVVVLYYMNDLSLQEISEILTVPVGTVKSRLHYGRIAMRRHLGLQVQPEAGWPDLNFEGP